MHTDIQPPPLSVHFINCGQGNMTLILAARAVLLYDCRVTEDDQERILAHLRRYIPSRIDDDGNEAQWIDWFIVRV